jgi:hypothetical protein
MTVWMVYFKDKNEGAYVAAPTCAAAKEAFQARYGTEHNIRARHMINVDKADFPSTAVLVPGDPRTAKMRFSYEDRKEK